ncbi:hypothetical protein BGZ50_004645 [Haplosporangium sp. Z 11]|nr:hypothetical protein BGZ50_004645 [Haplosporangium sp. Z 11]
MEYMGEENKNLLLSSTCVDYKAQRIPRKHFYLVQRIYINFDINYGSTLTTPMLANGNMDKMDNMEQVTKALEEEVKKRARELAIAEDFEDCERELRDVWLQLGKVIHPLGP